MSDDVAGSASAVLMYSGATRDALAVKERVQAHGQVSKQTVG